ncbi:MAG: hypothetical protein D6763_08880, partial [Alphaproteobacteria bacterium]
MSISSAHPDHMHRQKGTAKRWLMTAGKIALVVIIIGLIGRNHDLREAFANVGSLSLSTAAAVLTLFFTQQAIASLRLYFVTRMFGHHLEVGEALRVTLIGNFFGQTFVSFLGGDAARFWELRKRGMPLREAGSAVLLDRLIGLIGNHLLIVLL